jgi:hypothetical protein
MITDPDFEKEAVRPASFFYWHGSHRPVRRDSLVVTDRILWWPPDPEAGQDHLEITGTKIEISFVKCFYHMSMIFISVLHNSEHL